MTDQAALFAAVADAPDDDAPRLVLADWLDEHGDAADADRARLIRLQIAATTASGAAADELRREAEAVIARRWREWTCGYRNAGDSADTYSFFCSRGFLWRAVVSLDDLGDPGLDAMLDGEPAAAVEFVVDQTTDSPPTWRHLGRVRSLDLRAYRATNLLRSPQLTGLRELDGNGALTGRDIREIASDARFASLERLSVGRCGLRDDDLAALAHSPVLGRLARLDLHSNPISLESLADLADSPLGGRLRSLGTPGSFAWESSLRGRLSGWFRGRSACRGRALAQILSRFGALTELGLWDDELDNGGAEALADEPGLSRLTKLSALCSGVSAAGLAALLHSTHLRSVTWWDFSNRRDEPVWVGGFADAPPRDVEWLNLSYCRLDAGAAEALAASPFLAGVRFLSLGGNRIGDAGAVALARSPFARSLHGLQLVYCDVGDAGAAALLESPIPDVRLEGNPISPDVARRLRERFGAVGE